MFNQKGKTMKKQMVLILLLAIPLILGCSKVKVWITPTFPLFETFDVDQTGAFNTQVGFSASEVQDALELPEDTQVDSVLIEGISVTILTKDGNTASSITASARVWNNLSQGWDNVFTGYSITLPPVGQETTIAIDNLDPNGIGTLYNVLNSVVLEASYVGVSLDFTVNPVPGGASIVADITLTVVGSIKGWACLDMPPGTDHEPCES
jgi:hypothetical protein